MVAVVAGNGLGLWNSSANVLGGAGVLGLGALGQAGGRAWVNASTGNLVLQFSDEGLAGRGYDLSALRTYNSQGTLSDGLGTGWSWDAEATLLFDPGAGNAARNAGGTVTLTSGDGHARSFSWNGTSYVSREGGGAYDTLVFESGSGQWVYTQGGSRLVERYSDSVGGAVGRLVSRTDASGNAIDYGYTNGRLTSVRDHGSGQWLELVYGGTGKLAQLNTHELRSDGTIGAALKQVEYLYDGQGRLQTVQTDLTPQTSTDSQFYTTTYSYEGTSTRITQIAQSDGTSVSFSYYADATHRLQTVTDASGTQSFVYDDANHSTAIRFDAGDGTALKVWTYTYDATTQQLLQVSSPAPVAGQAALVTRFHYDANGNVDSVTDARNNTVTYRYDAQGNRIRERDALGNTLTRTYGAKNELLSETRYVSVDPNGDDEALPTDALTTRFVYDAAGRLRFVVSAEGRVSESRYGDDAGSYGLLVRTIQYAGNRYGLSTLTSTQVPSLAQLQDWVAQQDKRQVQQTQYGYDGLGNLSRRSDYANVDVQGEGVLDDAASVQEYVYSAHGELLQTIVKRGVSRTSATTLTSIAYDGLGREVSRVDASGTHVTSYDGVARTIRTVTNETGLVQTRSFDARGRLVGVTSSATGETSRTTQYVYNAAGQLRVVQDALGQRTFSFYDAAGRLQYQVDSTGSVTGFEYNEAGQLTKQTAYATRIDAAVRSTWVSGSGATQSVTQVALTVGAEITADTLHDRSARFEYDEAGRLTAQIDAANVVTTRSYDGSSRLTQQRTAQRTTRYLYDADGRQVGVVDAQGYLTESKYDAAGRLIQTIRYTTRSANEALGDVSAPVWAGVSNQRLKGGQAFSYRLPAFDADGDTLRFSAVSALPAWLSLDETTGTLRGTPPKTLADYTVRVHADDGRGPGSDVTLTLTVVNSAPLWADLPDAVVAVNKAGYSLLLPAASDNESSAAQLTYFIDPLLLPPGLSFNAGTLTGTPTTPGTYVITARVTDGSGAQALSTYRTFTLTVSNQGPAWGIDRGSWPQVFVNSDFHFTVPPAVDPEQQALTYSALSLPGGLSFNAVTRELTGRPTALGSQVVVLQARDPNGEIVQLRFSVEVKNRAPIWDAHPAGNIFDLLPGAQADKAYSFTPVAAVEPDGEAITYSATGLPTGLRINAATGEISGTASVLGTFVITLTATDPHGESVSRSTSLWVINSTPVFHGIVDPDALQSRAPNAPNATPAFSFNIPAGTFTDANNTDAQLSYSASGTTAWLHFDPDTRRFFGNIPSGFTTNQSFFVTVTVTDRFGASTSGVVKFAVLKVATGESEFVGSGEDAAERDEDVPTPPQDMLAAWRPQETAGLRSYFYYDGAGRVVGAVDERGALSETVYDEAGNTQRSVQYRSFVTVQDEDTLTSLRGRADTGAGTNRSTTVSFDGLGRLSTSTDVEGTVTRNEYDGASRLVRAVRAQGTSEARGSRIRYNAFGEVTGTVGGVGDATGLTSDEAIAGYGIRSEYDTLGRLIRTINANGDPTLYYYDSAGRLAYTVNALGGVSETLYNAFGQADSVRRYATRLGGAFVESATGGLVDSAFLAAVAALKDDGKDQLVRYEYDQRGLLSTTTDAEGYVTTNSYSTYGELADQVRTILKAAGGNSARTTTTHFDYDLVGRLVSQTADVGGLNYTTQTRYDAYGRVIQSIDGAGRVLQSSYENGGRAVEVKDALGRTARTEYDAFARVLNVYNAHLPGVALGDVRKTSYSYNDAARSVSVTTPEGVTLTTTRNRHGQVLTAVDGRGKTTRYAYNEDGQLTTVTDALDQVVSTNTYDELGHLIETRDARGVPTWLVYDALNRVIERYVDHDGDGQRPNALNLVTRYQFDALGRQIEVTEAADTASARVTSYQYDRNGQLTQVIVDPQGLKLSTRYSFDGLGNALTVERGTLTNPSQQVTRYEFDALGRRVAQIEAPSAVFGAGSARTRDLTTRYVYDAAGQLTRVIDANGNSTWYVYDAAGQRTHTINSLGEVTQSIYDESGRVVQSRSYLERLSATAVAGFGDVVETVTPVAGGNDQRSYFVYDEDGRQRYTVRAENLSTWSISENRYDADGNLVETRRYEKLFDNTRDPSDPTKPSPIDTQASQLSIATVRAELTALGYDDASEATIANIQRTRFAYDADNRLRFTVDALGGVSETSYDAAGNVVATVRYAARPTLSGFDETTIGNAVDRLDTRNQITHLAYDAAGRLRFTVQVLASDTQGKPTQQLVSELQYDALGQLVQTRAYASVLGSTADHNADTIAAALAGKASATDRRSALVYDAAGRQVYNVQVVGTTAAGVPQHRVVRQVYDALGQVVQATAYEKPFALGDFSRATLDNAVALTANQSAQDRTTKFVYDAAGRQRFVVLADGAYSETLYDALGQVTEQRQFAVRIDPATIDPALATAEGILSAARTGHAVGDGVTRGQRYSYDSAGRVVTTVDAAGNTQVNQYNGLGDRVSYTDKRGSTWSYSYDRVGRLYEQTAPAASLLLSDGTTATSGLRTRFYYDALGNLIKTVDALGTIDARQTQYGYDRLGRQTVIQQPVALIQLSNESAPVSRSLLTNLEYDALGNLTQRTEAAGTVDARSTRYEYDALGRQTRVTLPGYYDPSTRRVEKAQSAGGGRFERTLENTYDAFGEVVQTRLRTGSSSYQYGYQSYDLLGRLSYDVDALNHVTGFDYNVFGDQTGVTRYSLGIGAPSSGDGLWTAQDIASRVSADAQARNVTTTYDRVGRKLEARETGTSYYAGSTAAAKNAASVAQLTEISVTQYDYDAFGEIAREALKVDAAGTDASGRNGHWRDTWHYYDVLGRQVRTIDAAGYHTERSYDANDNLTRATEYANAGSPGSLGGLTAPLTPSVNNNDRITVFNYDSLDRQIGVQRLGLHYSRWNSSTQSYEQVANGRDVATTMLSVVYDSMGHVRTQTDALGNVTTTDYNALGQTIRITEPARLTAGKAALDPFLGQVASTPIVSLTLNAFGQAVKQERTAGAGAGARQVSLQSYDFAGNLIASTDANRVSIDDKGTVSSADDVLTADHRYDTLREYDYAGRLVRQSQLLDVSLGDWKSLTQTLERRYGYDALGRQSEVVDGYQQVRWNADGSATLTGKLSGKRSVYNAFGEVTHEQRVSGDAGSALSDLAGTDVALYSYDNAGHVLTKTAAGGVTQYYYNLAGQVTRQEQRAGGGGSEVRITETGYDESGRAVIQRAPNFGAVSGGSSGITPFSRQSFDRWGNVVSHSVGGYVSGNATSEGALTTYEYDADNHLIAEHLPEVRVERANGTSYQARVSHEIRYDVLGRSVLDVQSVADDPNTTANEANANLRTRLQQYDSVGQLVAQVDGTGIRTDYVYDANGNRVGTRNAHGTVFVDEFDNNSNLTRHSVLRRANTVAGGDDTEYRSGTAGAAVVVRTLGRYQYDQANRRVGDAVAINANQFGERLAWSYTQFDERNLAVAQRTASRVLTRREYDALGNKTLEVDANNNGQHFDYDSGPYTLGRLSASTVGQLGATGFSGTATTAYSYDGFSAVLQETRSGSNNFRHYSYYENGLLKGIDDHIVKGTQGLAGGVDWLSATDTSTYEYDANGQRTSDSFTRTGQKEIAVGHWEATSTDTNGAPSGFIWVTDSTSVVSLTAEESPQRLTRTVYDELGRVRTVLAPASDNPGRASLTLSYEYDELGNRRQIISSYLRPGDTQVQWSDKRYTYDAEGRVAILDGELQNGQIVTGSAGTSVTYDDLGRRASVTKSEGSRQYDTGLLPTGPDGWSFQRITRWQQSRVEQYTYDDLDRLTKVEQLVRQRGKTQETRVVDGGGLHVVNEGLADQDTALMLAAAYGYDQRGARVFSQTYANIYFVGPDGGDARAELRGTTGSVYRDDGLLDAQLTSVPGFELGGWLTNQYDAAGVLLSYDYSGEAHRNSSNGQTNQITLHYTYEYSTEFGGYKVKSISSHAIRPSNSTAALPGDAVTENQYDSRGLLLQQIIRDPSRVRTLTFSYDNDGRITSKSEAVKPKEGATTKGAQDYFYEQGHEVAVLGSGTLQVAQFDNNFTPVSGAYPGATPGSHVVNTGDTLAGIAQAVFGDASLWYLIADANSVGFGPTDALPSTENGKTYRIPNVIASVRNAADTFKPYNPASIIGDGTPTPAFPVPSCDDKATKVLSVAVVAAASVALAAYLGPAFSFLGPILSDAVAAATASAATQAAGWSLGASSFSGNQVLGAAIAGFAGGAARAVDVGFAADAAASGSESIFGTAAGLDNPLRALAESAQGWAASALGGLATGREPGSLVDLALQSVVQGTSGLGNAVAQVAASALNPDTGWLLHSRDWSEIAASAIAPFAAYAGSQLGDSLRPQAVEPVTSPNGQIPADLLSDTYADPSLRFARFLDGGGVAFAPGDSLADKRQTSLDYTERQRQKIEENLQIIADFPDTFGLDENGDLVDSDFNEVFRFTSSAPKDAFALYGAEDVFGPVAQKQQALSAAAIFAVRSSQPQWVLGPRGEHLPTRNWVGGALRDTYTKPKAIDFAQAGLYQAAEAAENYLCPTCHVFSHVDPKQFSIGGYVRATQGAYLGGVKAAVRGIPVFEAYNLGVHLKETISGTHSGADSSGLLDIVFPVDEIYPAVYPTYGFVKGGPIPIGSELSTTNRILTGLSIAVATLPVIGDELKALAAARRPITVNINSAEVDPQAALSPVPTRGVGGVRPDGVVYGELTTPASPPRNVPAENPGEFDVPTVVVRPGPDDFSELPTNPGSPRALGVPPGEQPFSDPFDDIPTVPVTPSALQKATGDAEALIAQGPSLAGKPFLTLDSALRRVSREIYAIGTKVKLELGGYVYKPYFGLGKYRFTTPVVGRPLTLSGRALNSAKVPWHASKEAIYHSHVVIPSVGSPSPGLGGFPEIFSPGDIFAADIRKIVISVVTPSGLVRKYAPNSFAGLGRGRQSVLGNVGGR